MRLRTQLIVMATASLLPVLLAAGIALDTIREGERQAALRGLRETVRATALIVDREVQGSLSGLKALGNSPHLASGDLKAFYDQAKALNLPPNVSTLLLDSSGAQLLNTIVPVGEPLPPPMALAQVTQVIARQEPLITDVLQDSLTGKMMTTIYVPAQAAGGKSFVVAQVFSVNHWKKTALQRSLPADWVVAVIDRKGKFISRSHQTDERLGKPARPELVAAAAAERDGLIRHATLENIDSYDAFAHSALTGWTIAVAAPVKSIEAAARHAVQIALIGLLLALAAAVTAVAVFGRRLIDAFESAQASAKALGEGRKPETTRSSIDEVNSFNAALVEAGAVLELERQSRRAAEAQKLRLLEEATLAQEAAVAQNIAKDQFLAMLGHELRNPLAAISGATQLLEMPGADSQRLARCIAIISRQNQHLSHIVNDLLDVSRLIAGKIELVIAPLDLAACLTNCIEALRNTQAANQGRISLLADPVWIHGDAVRIEQILNNLLSNALKFSAPDGKITVRLQQAPGRAVVSLRDEGIGMAPDLLARVFEPFVQGPPPLDRLQSGMGIGLALVRQLVVLHGGEVTASSAGPGKGSTFTFWIPSVPVQQTPAAVAHAKTLLPCRIAYVEDNEDARAVMAQLLASFGFEVLEAADGQSALAVIHASQADVVLMDIGLPDMNGYEVARRLKDDPSSRSIPLIALTGYGQRQDKESAFKAGFAAHLVKPVDPYEMLRTIDDVLASASPRRIGAASAE